jgi:hypothetical protein
VQFANGRYLVSGLTAAQQDDLVKTFALVAERISTGSGAAVKQPRIGLFQPWSGSMDAGWTKWVLEQYGFAFTELHPEDLKTPLTGRIDVVVLAEDARIPTETAGGGRGGRGGGGRGGAVRPEYAARLSDADLASFEQFVRGGGMVVCLNSASAFAIQQFKLPVKNVVAGLRSEEFFLHGSIVEPADRRNDDGGAHRQDAGFRVQQHGVRDRRRVDGQSAREIPGVRFASAIGLPHR